MISMQDVAGTLSQLDIEAEFYITYCTGKSTPVFENWNMQFGAHLFVKDDCTLGLEFDQNSVNIEHDELDINIEWDDLGCIVLYLVADVLIEIDQYMVPMMIELMLPLIVNTLNREMREMLPTSESIPLDSFGIEEEIGICYHNVTLLSNA